MTVAQVLQHAVALHQSGDLDKAEAQYRDVLQIAADHPDACHLLGVLLGQRGQPIEAIRLIQKAITIQPNEAMFHNNLGNLLRETGELPAAADAFAKAIQLRPSYFEALNNLGNVQLDLGDAAAAINSYRHAGALHTSDARLTINLGSALLAAGQLTEALAEYRKAIQLDPSLALGFNNYGVALLQAGQTQASLIALSRAVELQPQSVDNQIHLAAALRQAARFEEAAAACQAALAINPNSAEAYNTLANVLGDQGRTAESVEASRKAVALKPTLAEGHANLGVGFGELHKFADAISAFENALRLSPDFAEGHRNFGMALLTIGDFERGWREYEWRWKSPSFQQHACNVIPCAAPRWNGEPLHGRSILLQAEQGLGDTIQFARYIPLVAERGGVVTVSAPKPLHRLLSTVAGVQRVVAGLSEADAAAIDLQCPLMSLPLTLELFEPLAAAPYLSAPIDSSLSLYSGRGRGRGSSDFILLDGGQMPEGPSPQPSPRVQGEGGRLRVGLVWAGNPKLSTDRLRSIPLAQFEPVLRLAQHGIEFFSLQLGPAAEQLQAFTTRRRMDFQSITQPTEQPASAIVDLTPTLTDFADTAALIETLDLVIAVDTAVAHLSAALGKPTWVLIPHIADWRWQLHRTDSPWYPTLRLFRQTVSGDWSTPIAQVAAAVEEIADFRLPIAE